MKYLFTFLTSLCLFGSIAWGQADYLFSRAKDLEPFEDCDFMLPFHEAENRVEFGMRPGFRSFDIKQRNDSIIYLHWEDDAWEPYFKQENIYEENEDESIYVFYYYLWDSYAGEWYQTDFYWFQYDDDGVLKSVVWYTWDDQWVPSSKDDYIYDEDGFLTELLKYLWDPVLAEWTPHVKSIYTYNDDGFATQRVHLQFVDGQWQNTLRETYTYDLNNQWSECIREGWHPSSEIWEYFTKTVFERDSFGDIDEEIRYLWDSDTQSWEFSLKRTYFYDAGYATSDLLLPFPLFSGIPHYFSHKLLYTLRSFWDNGNWEAPSQKVVYYYSEYVSVSTTESFTQELSAFPNPATDYITLQLPDGFVAGTFCILDIQGHEVLQQELRGTKEIDVAALHPGLYFYILSDENDWMYGKFVKK